MSTSTEARTFSNIAATTAAFALKGGKYDVIAKASGAGSMGLQIQAADGTVPLPYYRPKRGHSS